MAGRTKVCRVCGRTYEACHTANTANIFRWRDVACSPECGAEYLRRVLLSRETNNNPAPVMANEDYYGFEGEPDEEYENEFGSDE